MGKLIMDGIVYGGQGVNIETEEQFLSRTHDPSEVTFVDDDMIDTVDIKVENGIFKYYDKGIKSWNDVKGVSDYNELENIPSIAGTRLSGNVSLNDLGIASKDTLSGIDSRVSLIEGDVTHLKSLNGSTAGAHNSIYLKKDITEYFTDNSIWDRISGSNGYSAFEGIYPGCEFTYGNTITATGSDTTGTNKYLVLGCNLHWNTYNGMRYNHITVCPLTHFGKAQMNTSNVTTGAYQGSKMYSTIIGTPVSSGSATGTINQQLYNTFGEHLKTSTELLANSINTSGYNRYGSANGCSNNWSWYPCQAVLMSEIEAYGSIAWSSSGFDTGTAKLQMPAFRNNVNDLIPDGIYWWLKDVAASTYFCIVNYYGIATSDNASDARFVRPRFIIS